MSDHEVDEVKRAMLTSTVAAIGGVGVVATAVPFVESWQPSAKTQAAGAPVEVDLTDMQPRDLKVVQWRRKPVWVLRRDAEELASLEKVEDNLRDPESQNADQPAYIKGRERSLKPEYLVLVGVCTHLGCSPTYRPESAPQDLGPDWVGGFLCPCHGGRYDLAGRVFKGVPPPKNLAVPPYRFVDDTTLIIGEDPEEV